MNFLLKKQKFTFKISGTSFDMEVVELTLEERLSTPYRADLVLACEETVPLENAIGKEGLLTIHGESSDRLVHGIIHRFAQSGRRGRFILYDVRLAPQIWLLSQKQDSRIFQNQGVREIVPEILKEGGVLTDQTALRLQETYKAKEYGVQYQETDLAFLSRLLESEGIWYFFEQSRDKHVVVMADSRSAYKPVDGDSSVAFKQAEGMAAQGEVVYQFAMSTAIVPGKVSQTDFNYNTPSLPLASQQQGAKNQALEIYEYPGGYENPEAGQRLAKVRLQEMTSMQETGEGSSTCPRLAPGYIFRIKGHPTAAFNRDYLVVSVKHHGTQPQALEETGAPGAISYTNQFTAIPAETTFRPARKTPKPVIQGPQTAVVMGPEDEEIYTDEQGRVKVRFHWDRGEAKDEKSSCWIRVSQFWAGEGWGAMFLPRKGQEVIVSFLDGDPDRPIITGRVYNGANPTPHALPDHKTKSTILSQSTEGGGGANELSFEDAQGSEEVYLHGQKNLRIQVENDKQQLVGHDETLIVRNNRVKNVASDQQATIGGVKSETVVKASMENVGLAKVLNVGVDYSVDVGAAHTIIVGGAMNTAVGLAQAEQVGLTKQIMVGQDMSTHVQKNHTLDISGAAAMNVGKSYSIEVGDSFEIVCGQSSFKLDKDGTVTLTGKQFKFQASGPVQINGETVNIN
jgi:type VI secretion system secreted protein VgrG